MKIFIYADISKKSGFGHFIRSYSIYEELRKKSNQITFVIKNPRYEIYLFLKKKKIQVISYKNFIKLNKYKNMIIIDSYKENKKFYNKLKKQNLVIQFSDIKKRPAFGNVIIENNFDLKKKKLKKNDYPIFIYGPKYSIIRKQIFDQKISKKNDHIKKIYISFGGYEYKKTVINFFRSLVNSNLILERKIELIININSYRNLIKSIFANQNKIKLIFKDYKLFNKFKFNKIDASINAGGVTSLEMIYLKIPQFCLILSENQRNNLKLINKKKFGLMLPFDKNKTNNDFKNSFINFNANYKIYQKSLSRQSLIDGFGARRLVKYIFKIYEKKF